jgi:hypothetical protein
MALRESTALEVLPDLMPVLPVCDSAAPEMALLRRERRFTLRRSFVPTVGQFAEILLCNPAGSGALFVIEEVYCYSSSQGYAACVLLDGSLGAVDANTQTLDWRGVPAGSIAPRPRAQFLSRDAAAVAAASPRVVAAVTGGFERPFRGAVLSPGSLFVVTRDIVTVSLTADFTWRERAVTADELQPAGA